MASKVKTQGQEAVVCDLCRNPVSFFCRRCGVSLCDSCVPDHLRISSKVGHDVVDFTKKGDGECSVFCKMCDLPICKHKMSECSVNIEEVLKSIAQENGLLQSFRRELETLIDPAQIQEFLKREVEEKIEGLMKRFLKTIVWVFFLFTLLNYFLFISENSKGWIASHIIHFMDTPMDTELPATECKINENDIENYFGNIEKMLESKISMLEKRYISDPDSGRKVLEVPSVSSVIDTGFPADDKYNNRLYDMAVTDDQKVWMGGESYELKLFDLQGHLHRTVIIPWIGTFICMYNKQVMYSDYNDNTVKKISDDDTVVTMFTTGDWKPKGITGSVSGDLLVCLIKDDQSKVVRYSNTGTVLQEIQYDSQCQPLYQYAWYITENVNGDIIVTDNKTKKVGAVDRLGIFRYSYSGGKSASSVATDSFGHVFVTDYKGDKIHVLDRDGRFLRYIIPEGGIEVPRAVCMVGDGEMIVGEQNTGLAKRIKFLEEQT